MRNETSLITASRHGMRSLREDSWDKVRRGSLPPTKCCASLRILEGENAGDRRQEFRSCGIGPQILSPVSIFLVLARPPHFFRAVAAAANSAPHAPEPKRRRLTRGPFRSTRPRTKSSLRFFSLSASARICFTQELSTLLNAGIPLDRPRSGRADRAPRSLPGSGHCEADQGGNRR
jgi:hypothetical protein